MKRATNILSILLLVVVAIVTFYHKELVQLYHTIRLYHADVIVHNFSNMKSLAPTKTIRRSGIVDEWSYRLYPLPERFPYNGNLINTHEWLKESGTTALLVIKGDDITFEQYFQGTEEYDYRISWSVAKSFLSAIFGVAASENLIPDLNAPVTDYVPSLIGSGYDGVSIKNVLQMSSGIDFNEDYGDFCSDINRLGRIMALGGSFDDFAASLASGRKQGTFMHYVSVDTHVLGMVLRAATGEPVTDYFDKKLWSKLNTERDALYITDSTGEPMVLGGLNLITRDYARFGRLYRDHGRVNGKQVIPEQWIEKSITPDAPHLLPGKRDSASTKLGYGYQWWIPEDADQEFAAIGIYGQYIYINRKADVVIVKNSADIDFQENKSEIMDYTFAAFRAISRSLSDY